MSGSLAWATLETRTSAKSLQWTDLIACEIRQKGVKAGGYSEFSECSGFSTGSFIKFLRLKHQLFL